MFFERYVGLDEKEVQERINIYSYGEEVGEKGLGNNSK